MHNEEQLINKTRDETYEIAIPLEISHDILYLSAYGYFQSLYEPLNYSSPSIVTDSIAFDVLNQSDVVTLKLKFMIHIKIGKLLAMPKS